MAMRVVDLLEPVDIEISDARWRAITPGKGDHPRQLADKRAAIRDRGQRILVGEALELRDSRPRVLELTPHPVVLGAHVAQRLARLRAQLAFSDSGQFRRI